LPARAFSLAARDDLNAIADYTVDTWGEAQALRYLSELERVFTLLETSPRVGRTCDHIRRGYRRFEVREHVVFYRVRAGGVFIGRILHTRMLPSRDRLPED
jgi:toxin ParE1/3/4